MSTPSETAKNAGLKSLEQMSLISGRSTSTLKDWFRDDRQLFEVVLLGCVSLKANPFGVWIKPETLIEAGFEGRVVYKTMNGKSFAGFIKSRKVWNSHTVKQAAESEIYKLMAYRDEG